MKKRAFTLAEVMITLAIIGVVAAICIPSVVANVQQEEYKTGLKKAISVLNSAITMNTTIENETPYDNGNLFGYLQRHMSIIETAYMPNRYRTASSGIGQNDTQVNAYHNYAFYTTDGMRFEFNAVGSSSTKRLHEDRNVAVCTKTAFSEPLQWKRWDGSQYFIQPCGGCGSYGLSHNPNSTTKPPCLIAVDINGDKKPNPANAKCKKADCSNENKYKYADPNGNKLTDIFTIMITESKAIPYGVAAQRAMYSGKVKKNN